MGTTAGSVYVYSHLVKSGSVLLSECSFRKDSSEEISDIKFSPSNSSLAVGSHDNYIIVYSCALAVDDSTRWFIGIISCLGAVGYIKSEKY